MDGNFWPLFWTFVLVSLSMSESEEIFSFEGVLKHLSWGLVGGSIMWLLEWLFPALNKPYW